MGCSCTDREKSLVDEKLPAAKKEEGKAPSTKKEEGKAPPQSLEKPRKTSADRRSPSPSKLPKANKTPKVRSSMRSQTVKVPSAVQRKSASAAKEGVRRLIEPLTATYTLGAVLMRAADRFTITSAVLTTTQQKCVIKTLPKKKEGKFIKESQRNAEIATLWKAMEHPCVPRIYEVLQDETSFYIVSEPVTGECLKDFLAKGQAMPEKAAANVLFQVFGMLQLAHSQGVLHEKISLDSILLLSSGDNPQVKVLCPADLDGKLVAMDKRAWPFTAPEVASSEASSKSDIWSCGIVLYYLLSGEEPLTEEQYAEFEKQNKKAKIDFPPHRWKSISVAAKTLIALMTNKEPTSRLEASQCQANEWILANRAKIDVTSKSLRRTLTNLKQAKPVTPLKAAILKFMVSRVMADSDVAKMASTFTALDVDGSGTITEEEITRGFLQIMPADKAQEAKNRIMACADKDGSGMISYNEFLMSAIDEREVLSQDNLVKAFHSLDRDGSDTVSVSELKSALFERSTPETEKLWRSMTQKLSILDDGQLSYTEFENLMRKAAARSK